jgi:hypothetical protein
VVKATPAMSAAGPATPVTIGTSVPASSITATFTSGASPTGTIDYSITGPSSTPTCTGGTSLGTATATAAGDTGSYSPTSGYPSGGWTPTSIGDYWLYASYPSGDNNNNAANSGCGASEVVVSLATPTLTVTGPAAGTVGTAIPTSSIGATIAGGDTPTGTISYYVYGPQATAPTTCAGTALGTATSTGDNTYHPSAGFTPTTAGDYWWYATYPGDTHNSSTNSGCGAGMAETVVPVKVSELASPAGTGTNTSSVTATLPSTPAAGSTVLVLVYAEATSGTPAISSIGGSILVPGAIPATPTLITSASPAANYEEWAYWAPATGTGKAVPVTMTGNVAYLHVDVIDLAGNNTSTPIAQEATNTGTSATPTATLPTAPASGDLEVAFNGAGANDGSVGASTWTTISNNNGANYGVSSYYSGTAGSTSQAFSFTNSVTWATIALDIEA